MTRNQWIGSVVLVFVSVALVVGIYRLCTGVIEPEIRLPVLAISGVIALLLSLAVVAGAFTLFNLSDGKEALGLPEGSVRAVIALSLIVLFAILTVYLYTDLSRGQLREIGGLTETQKDQLLKVLPKEQVIGTLSDGAAAEAQRFTVLFRDVSVAGQDFAKQLLVMIGTLVTAVASFYFGGRTGGTPVLVSPLPVTPMPMPTPKPPGL